MSNIYYKIPLQLGAVVEGSELPVCSLRHSIEKNLELIITTRFGEHRSDPDFGCEIWEMDFELIVSTSRWEEKLRQSLLKSITTHELRLADVSATVVITDIEKFNIFKNFTEQKKRVDIHITGTIRKTGEPFAFHTNMFLSPLSVE
ncbi:GPW/gp25 family protein [Danxiaibacter flavus]|uniref:GPW/gp25 family protein n=1 Tax=Danxiaibacter flavus TaxID=3049108 RepID=A0ABV3ZE92_9BACT|nr:GPW/gp25 family protein [Chitinophagaceae bacterium DXS]